MDEVLIICARPNQINYAKFNLYDYSLVTAITFCCYAYMVRCCNLVLIGRHNCFMVNCKSRYVLCHIHNACLRGLCKVITPYSNNFLSCPFPKVLVYRYLYECYVCFVLLCIFYGNCAICYAVDIYMSVCLFGVVVYTLWLCGKMLLWL